MKAKRFSVVLLAAALVFSGCNMSNTAKGGLIGGGGGAALGALIGKFAGNTAIGAAIGTAVGTGAGVLIGHKMDKAKKAAEAVQNAKVETITDANGLEAVKVTFDSGILFSTSSSVLSSAAQTSLSKFASTVLLPNTDMDVSIQGYTDNQGFKGSSASESQQKNVDLSKQRAQSVENYLRNCGVGSSQIKSTDGYGENNPVGDNTTASGRKLNRRVEVYLYASKAMIEQANKDASK
jgi:outer membrane protein OmpA-like peptidoglycan-associated protein